jgi:hypothetical protein
VLLGILEISEVFALDPFVFRVVFRHGFSPLLDVTVYGGRIALVYLSLCLRKRDVQIPLIASQSRLDGAPIDHRVTVRANAD